MGLSKYDRGFAREIYEAARNGEISQPFNVAKIRLFAEHRWAPTPTESFLRSVLPNSEVNDSHSLTYKKYFRRVRLGWYENLEGVQ